MSLTTSSRPLPIPLELRLRNFSLYENQAEIKVAFNLGVFCLAGANGLGKSTFLNTLNFAITGLVAEPGRKFDSLTEYYRYTSPYARSYFDGRIATEARDIASVQLKMKVGENTYTIERRFFDSESLAYFSVHGLDGEHVSDDAFNSDAERNAAYKARIAEDCGLAQFEQLVFLQHFLLTFDEQHRLLLWDERTIDQTLLLAFGVDAHSAVMADEHRRKAERLDSQARNLQYQATTAEGRVQDLKERATIDEAEAAADVRSFEELEEEWRSARATVDRLTGELQAAQTIEAEAHARLTSVEQAYEDVFAQALGSSPGEHPIVVNSMQADKCDLCGTYDATARLTTKLDAHTCPLCNAAIEPPGDAQALDGLSAELASIRRSAREASSKVSELVGLRQTALNDLASIESDRSELTGSESDVALSQATVQRLITQYELEAEDARHRRDEFRARRDEHRRALKPIARELALKYAGAEEQFVPRFTALAHRFLGLEVEVYLQQRGAKTGIIVAVEGTERRTFDQLSESQRYFLDIALRMALVEYMARERGGCLYVDTPEGSLDISYEARAGEMFADFATGNRLVMTANINTSQLLLSLAKRSTPASMQIVRMMEWTALSEVQAEGENLFTQAFGELRRALLETPKAAL